MTQTLERVAKTTEDHRKAIDTAILADLYKQGYRGVRDAALYMGLSLVKKQGQNTIARWHRQGKLPATTFYGRLFYHLRDLDNMKELLKVQRDPVTPLPASHQDRYYPNPVLAQSPATSLLDEEEQQESQEEEEELDLEAVWGHIQMLALQTAKRLGIVRLTDMQDQRITKVDLNKNTHVWYVFVKTHIIQVRLEQGRYTAYCPDLIPYLEQQIDELTQEVIAQEQLARIYRGKVTHIHVDGLAVDMEKLDGDRVRLTCTDHDFPFQAIGPNRERAEANLRFLLRACLCNYERDAETHGLTIPQESQLAILKLLFDEVE